MVIECEPLVNTPVDTQGRHFSVSIADVVILAYILVIELHRQIITQVLDINFEDLREPLWVLATIFTDF